MRLVDGVNTQLTWEEIELSWAKDADGNDVLLLLGTEPDHAWLAFSEQVVDLAVDLGARMVRRPRRLPHAGPAHPPAAARGLGVERGARRRACSQNTVEVPVGVQGMIERRAAAPRPARARALGAGAALRRRPCRTRRRRSRCSRAPTASPASTCRSADLAERADASRPRIDELIAPEPRAHRHARAARGAGRPAGRQPPSCRPPAATSWPPSSSASSASRASH